MPVIDPFSPISSTTLSVSGSTASAAISNPVTGQSRTVRLHNPLSEIVFVKFGASDVVATTSDMALPAGAVEFFEVGPSATHIAGITAGGSGTLYITQGQGN